MPRYTNRQSHYEPRTPRPAPVMGFKWWKADHYDCVGDVVAPRSEPKAFLIKDVRKIRWDDLMKWGTDYFVGPDGAQHTPVRRKPPVKRQPLTPQVKQDICAWCEEFGLPGYLLATTRAIMLPLQVEERTSTDPAEQAAGPHFDSFVTTYTRVGATWVTSWDHIPPSELEGSCGAWDSGSLLRDNVPFHQHGWLDFTPGESASAVGLGRLAECLNVAVDDCPCPGSGAFWSAYREPFSDILLAGRLLARVRDEIAKPLAGQPYSPSAYHLLQGNGWVLNSRGMPAWVAGSLLNVYAHWRLVAGASVRVCPGCGLQFASNRPKQISCSTRCQQKIQQRRLRKAKSQKALATVRRVKKK